MQSKHAEALAEANAEPAEWASLTALGFVHYVAGRRAEYQEALRKLEETHANDTAYQIAALRSVGGDRDGAFAWLDRAYQGHDAGLWLVKHEPSFRPLHGDPRWGPFLKKIGLEA